MSHYTTQEKYQIQIQIQKDQSVIISRCSPGSHRQDPGSIQQMLAVLISGTQRRN